MTLVESAPKFWKYWSTRFDAVEYIVLGYFLMNPEELDKVVAVLPDGLQGIVAFAIPIVLFGAKQGAKVTKQSNVP